jgi:hypothetical protein
MTNIKPSKEQQNIIDALDNTDINISVNAVAGSGKTTTLLFIASKFKNKKILQITYNKQLKNEVRKKVEHLNNVDVQTYHGLAVKFYNNNCYTDDNLIKIFNDDMNIRYRPKYNIIIIDEAQDMTPNYYELIYKFIQDIGFKGNILIFGDSYQGIYEFKNADIRYLLFSSKLWERDDKFSILTLNESYRLTTQIANFVNKIMLGHERIISHKKGKHNVYYHRLNMMDSIDEMYARIIILLDNGYKYDDFFILSPSLKNNNNPSKKLENILVKNNIPVYFTRNDEDGIDEKIIANKIVFTTFHQSKGRERKIAFILGFDDSYFDFYAPEKNKNICPPELYVAVTRASEILIIVENNIYNPLTFLKKTPRQIKKYAFIDYKCDSPIKKIKVKKNKPLNKHSTTVKDLTMYLSEITINILAPLVNSLFIKITPPSINTTIDIPLIVKTKNDLIEDVSDLNGIVIPAIYESQIKKISSLEEILNNQILNLSHGNNNLLIINKINELNKTKNKSIPQYLLMGNIYIALTENIHFKLNQIDNYDWIDQHMIDICNNNLKNNISDKTEYEKTIYHNNKNYFSYKHEIYGEINIAGRIDACDDNIIWEFKCVSALTLEHYIQLILYAWIWNKCIDCTHKYRILNIRTGEVQELKYQNHIIDEIIELLFINKYDQKIKDDDKNFLIKCEKIRHKYCEAYDDDIMSIFGYK